MKRTLGLAQCGRCLAEMDGTCQACAARGFTHHWSLGRQLATQGRVGIHRVWSCDKQPVPGKLYTFPGLSRRVEAVMQRRFDAAQRVTAEGFWRPDSLFNASGVVTWIQALPPAQSLQRSNARGWPMGEAVYAGYRLFDILAQLHDQGLVHGQIDRHSVRVERRGIGLSYVPPLVMRGWTRCQAPETARGHAVTQASDVFCAAFVIASLFSPQPLEWPGPDRRLAWTHPELPETVRSVLDAALHPDPRRRLVDAATVRDGLQQAYAAREA